MFGLCGFAGGAAAAPTVLNMVDSKPENGLERERENGRERENACVNGLKRTGARENERERTSTAESERTGTAESERTGATTFQWILSSFASSSSTRSFFLSTRLVFLCALLLFNTVLFALLLLERSKQALLMCELMLEDSKRADR